MSENCEFVQRGFRILLPLLSGYIGQELSRTYGENWWDEVFQTLDDQGNLPAGGDYGELVDSLDIANCIRLINRKWNDVFKWHLSPDCRSWVNELMGVRNIVAHLGTQDLEQPMAERALNTMVLLCRQIDPDSADELRGVYQSVRARAADNIVKKFIGLAQPESASVRGELTEGSLLKLIGTDVVKRTTLTRKVTYAGKTVVYPVYRVRLDALYYNDQNDRIATWITRYETDNGREALTDLNRETYNCIIENFIVESNQEAILRTQKNIAIVGQREPGVTLADGRIVDGNRRYTCLRRLQRENPEPQYFETVIMDVDIQADRKQIKLLELAIQHGEEKKVDYDLIDYAVGTYRDVIQTKLLSVEEYAASTNESAADVRKRIEIAGIISEFLEYLRVPEQYHIAREFQVYGLFQEMLPSLKQLNEPDKQQLKLIAFNNAMMHAMPDQRKFIRDIKNLIKHDAYAGYFENQEKIGQQIQEEYAALKIRNKSDIDRFVESHSDLAEELQHSMDQALYKFRAHQLKAKPAENLSKSITLMLEVDPRQFDKMSLEEKEIVKSHLDEIAKLVEGFRKFI